MTNKGMFEIPLFAILAIMGQIRENSLIWSHHCIQFLRENLNLKVDRGDFSILSPVDFKTPKMASIDP